MNTLTLFIIEALLSFSISVTVVILIKPLLRDILIETCGTQKRAEFWVMFTQLMLIISTLLIVIYFAPTSAVILPNAAETLKDTLFKSLPGVFIALALIGQVIWKSITPASHKPVNTHKKETV